MFNNRDDARLYLFTEAKEKLVRPAYSARFSGKSLALLNPSDMIRRSVEYLLEGQKRFPLETANHLRGRLGRMHFAVYKRGSKGVSFVCAVKRRFRKPDEVLADNLQALIDFLEAHPNFPANNLPKAYLGGVPKKTEASETTAEEAPVAEDAGEETVDAVALKQLKTDLHYLVSQGYVIEYSDGRLYVPPIREDEIRHLEKQKAATENVAEQDSEPLPEKAGEANSAEPEPEAAADEPEEGSSPTEEEEEPESEAAAEEPEEESSPTVVEPEPEPEVVA